MAEYEYYRVSQKNLCTLQERRHCLKQIVLNNVVFFAKCTSFFETLCTTSRCYIIIHHHHDHDGISGSGSQDMFGLKLNSLLQPANLGYEKHISLACFHRINYKAKSWALF